MKNYFLLLLAILLISCSEDDDNSSRTMYTITYNVIASDGATLNKVEYRNESGDLVELTNVTAPWSITLRVRAGLALEAAAYGDVPYLGLLGISANWTPDGGLAQSESQTLPNNDINTIINNGRVEIPGRTLPD